MLNFLLVSNNSNSLNSLNKSKKQLQQKKSLSHCNKIQRKQFVFYMIRQVQCLHLIITIPYYHVLVRLIPGFLPLRIRP